MLDEPGDNHEVGQEVVIPASSLTFGRRSIVQVGGGLFSVSWLAEGADIDLWANERLGRFLQADGRCLTLPVELGSRTVAEAERLMRGPVGPLAPLKGPPTVEESMRAMLQRSSAGFGAAHDRWFVESKVEMNHRSRYEHAVISRCFQLAVQYDGLNAKRSVAFEYLNRRRQLIEEADREDPQRPDFANGHAFMGEDESGTGAYMSSALRTHVAQEAPS